MDTDLDTLATALYVRTDDWLKTQPQWAPRRPKVGSTPKITDAEMLTLAVMQALLGYVSECRWLRKAPADLHEAFPTCPSSRATQAPACAGGHDDRAGRCAGA